MNEMPKKSTVDRTTNYVNKQFQKQARYQAKQQTNKQKYLAKAWKRAVNAQSGGPKGWIARRLNERIERYRAKVQSIRNKPKNEQWLMQENTKADNQRKLSAVRGKTAVGVATALGGAVAGTKMADSMKEKAKSAASEAASNLLVKQLESVPHVSDDGYGQNVSGLIEGVR